MRRQDREVTDIHDIMSIIETCDVCRLAFSGSSSAYPYIVPLTFGFEHAQGKTVLYFHGASSGTKLDLLGENNHVAFQMDCSHDLCLAETACGCTMGFESVCGNGELVLVEGDEKRHGLTVLMAHYKDSGNPHFEPAMLKATAVLKLTVKSMTAKRLSISR